jgi:hypothetical protein
LIFSRTAKSAAPPSRSSRASPPATFGAFLLQEFKRRLAFGCVEPLIAVFVELLNQFLLSLHASEASRATTTRATELWRPIIISSSLAWRPIANQRTITVARRRVYRGLGNGRDHAPTGKKDRGLMKHVESCF